MTDSLVLSLAKDLIARPSVTPVDEGCQQLMAEFLAPLGFTIEPMVFHDTTNLWARKGTSGPLFCFAGHTDVVPPGPENKWHTPPFRPTIIDGVLYGRGAADMKGSIASMLAAVQRFVVDYPAHNGSIAFLITSDEEGPSIDGTKVVIEAWRREYNYERPKKALGGLTPAAYAKLLAEKSGKLALDSRVC